ncbi:aldehyde dehydrogenase family protein [Amycolatopsis pigmentata]|uniref:Aldehyde dehydrogenase family protein n=1 Tax=Amycolatopsis pigmentata TaxID=450801 RepID=A0ABW5G2H5_9PSEU
MDTFTPEPRPAWIAGRPERGEARLVVSHPFDGSEVADFAVPDAAQVERAVAAAVCVAPELRRSPAHFRVTVLERVSRGLAARAEELAEVITAECGKPVRYAEAEVRRAIAVFRIAAEEAREFGVGTRRLETEQTGEGRLAVIRRVPRGPVLGITPAASPLAQVARQVAPAVAVGAPVIVKPALRTPLSALVLGELLAETGLPDGAFSVLPLSGTAETAALVADPRLPVVSFSGSRSVGWSVVDAVPRKHVVLELGGNTAAVVLSDWPDLSGAAARIAASATGEAGQSRAAVRRAIVERTVADEFVPALVDAVQAQRTGDPYDPAVDVGPVVDEDAARRLVAWIEKATAAGAKVLTGGSWKGTTVEPTVLTDVPPEVLAEVVSGPVLAVSVADDPDAALTAIGDSGTDAGIFTRDVRLSSRAPAELVIGSVTIGDVPSDASGREGIPAAIRDLTEEHVTVLTGLPL